MLENDLKEFFISVTKLLKPRLSLKKIFAVGSISCLIIQPCIC